MIKLDVLNFRMVREAHLHDDGKMSVIVGYNENGKSSLVGALQWAFTGQAFGLKGTECDSLVTRGEQRMHVRCQTPSVLVNRTRSSGDSIKSIAERLSVPAEVLPLLFHQSFNGDGGNKYLKAFLQGAVGDRFDPTEHFRNDPDVAPRIERARKAGSTTNKQIVAYCESLRAQSKVPPAPQMPSVSEETDANVALLRKHTEDARQVLAIEKSKLNDLILTYNSLQAIRQHFAAQKAYEEAKAKASKDDPLKGRRRALQKVSALSGNNLLAIKALLAEAGLMDNDTTDLLETSAAVVQSLVDAAAKTLVDNPEPPGMPVAPVMVEKDGEIWRGLASPEDALLDEYIRTVAAEIQQARLSEADAKRNAADLNDKLESALAGRALWDHFRKAEPAWLDQKAAIETEWQRWDNAYKALLNAEADHIAKAGSEFEKLVVTFSDKLLNGRKITLSLEDGLKLGGLAVETESPSTRWRIELCVMAAIAQYLKSPLFIADGADILDDKNMKIFTDFLLEMICPHFEHTIITATVRGKLEDQTPLAAGATKWTIRSGVLTPLV